MNIKKLLSRIHAVEIDEDKRRGAKDAERRRVLIRPLSSLNRVCKKQSPSLRFSAFSAPLRLLDAFSSAWIRLTAIAIVAVFLTQVTTHAATVESRLEQYGVAARARLAPHFQNAGVAYPPSALVFIGLKEEKILQVYAKSGTNIYTFIRSYPIKAASGVAGPKLRQGDKQVPEGIYGIDLLNPNSSYHLSMQINYPNAYDRTQAQTESRTNLGGEIMIHGKALSVGCLAMGDEVAEELFVLAADTKIENITVVLAPVDFRVGKTLPTNAKLTPWTDSLYPEIKKRLVEFPLPKTK